MHRLALTAVVTLLACSPALAADTNKNTGTQATGADTSTGAQQQSSAPSGSGAENDMKSTNNAGASSDTSGGAKEQSSAPAGSSAADPSQPNPTMGTKP
jgi:hypothetical protein